MDIIEVQPMDFLGGLYRPRPLQLRVRAEPTLAAEVLGYLAGGSAQYPNVYLVQDMWTDPITQDVWLKIKHRLEGKFTDWGWTAWIWRGEYYGRLTDVRYLYLR